MASYNSLWQVEGALRELKNGLDLRPVYHFTDKRIRGHVAVCFLELVLESALRRKLEELGEDDLHYDELLLNLDQLKAVELVLDGMSYLVRTELTGQAALAFKALGMRPSPHVTELPRQAANPPDECCGTRNSYASNPNNDKDFHT